MSAFTTVCLGTSNTLRYPQGGHLWVFLNWALGFRSQGCRIIWLDVVDPNDSPQALHDLLVSEIAKWRAVIERAKIERQ